MKRIQAACLLQTIHFQLKEDVGHAAAVRAVKEEMEHYKTQLKRRRTKFQVVEESEQPDGSWILRIKKQYNQYDCGEYLQESPGDGNA